MRRLLLTVERAGHLFHQELGAHLQPYLSYRTLPDPPPAAVTLELPDGTERTVEAGYGQVHLNYRYEDRPFREPWMASCYLKGLSPDEVPAGSRVWYDDGQPDELASSSSL